jgi:hypothetical protein
VKTKKIPAPTRAGTEIAELVAVLKRLQVNDRMGYLAFRRLLLSVEKKSISFLTGGPE